MIKLNKKKLNGHPNYRMLFAPVFIFFHEIYLLPKLKYIRYTILSQSEPFVMYFTFTSLLSLRNKSDLKENWKERVKG